MYQQAVPPPSRASAWITVCFFTLLYMVSFLDRYILVLLAEPVQAEFSLSDAEFGILVGPAFGILYSIIGIPIAHLLDSGSRLRIVAGGVILWSACTILSGFAGHFGELAMARAGVAIGEAVLTPALVSLVFDLFEPDRRDRPMALFVAMGTLMTGGSFLIGGLAYDLATTMSGSAIPLAAWRVTMILVGIPGILLAGLLLLTQREPARRVPDEGGGATVRASIADFVKYMRDHWGFFIPFYLGIGIGVSIGLGCLVWAPAVLSREFDYGIGSAGTSFGLAAAPAAAVGTIFWTWGARRLQSGEAGRGPILALMASTLVMMTGAIVLYLAQSGVATTVAAGLVISGSASFTVLAAICSQMVGPPLMQARLTALNLVALNVMGSGLGPVFVPWMASFFGAASSAMRLGIVSYAFTAAPIALVCLLLAFRKLGSVAPQGAVPAAA